MVRPAPHMDEVNARDEASDEDDSLINPEPPAELRNLTYMDMGTNEICAADYIEIFDGPSTLFRSFGKMCTARQILTLSTTNFMHVEFKTSGNATFLATYKILDTNITLTEPQGFISSPGYPLGFLKNKFYTWTIQGQPDTFIILNLIDSNLDVWSCYYNSLNIYDGPTANSSCLDSCLMSPRLIVSTSNYLHIVFYSTNSINFRGFYGKYEIRDLNKVLNATTGTITNAGNTSKSSATNNTWTIRGPRGTIIAFNLTYMDMGTNKICAADYIEIFDGPWTLSRSFGKMCTARQILTLSTTNVMLVEFKTSGNATFLATYKILDTNITLTEPQGFISSPGYPLGFLKNKFYTWTIQGKPDTFIILNLIDSNLDVLSCFYNSLNIYDGPTANSSCLDSCLMSPRLIVSTSNYLHIVFYSTNSINFRGFYGNYEIRDLNEVLNVTTGTITNTGNTSSSSATNSTWTIRGPTGTIIAFK
ncbi:deleted in malignant brain tumors 1 protein-like [Physella acuta]|uniref:deleted in malignant brain tumors 1 protein-like n=1 Tax=Physella acuta TaxID=109671 RepID=UPI0027DCCF10|nr:deleted in malignant brain tumors 1 protein-like [Physella acuta]